MMKRLLATAALACTLQLAGAGLASAQMPYVSEVRLFSFNFCPVGWFQASGQLLPIQAYTPLFALIGTTYGGNGQTNFALPNLNGSAPYGAGTTPGLPPTTLGEVYGQSAVTLTTGNMPAHTHQEFASTNAPGANTAAGGLEASFPTGAKVWAAAGSPADVSYSPNAVSITGSNLPVNVQSPSLSMMWCIAYNGIFPSRP
jgi:microcystin-dependent protein